MPLSHILWNPVRRVLFALAGLSLAAGSSPAAGASSSCTPTGSPPSYTMGGINIEGIHYGGVPSEPCIAVGPNHIFCLGPGDVRVFDKATGQLLRAQCENIFFQTSTGCLSGADPIIGDGGGLIDPDCFFDRVAQRFVAVSFSLMGTGGKHVQSHVHLAVSQTSNPLDPWYVYHLTTTTSPFAPGFTYIPDRPSLGISLDKIAVASHMFSLDDGLDFTQFNIINRDSAYNHTVPDPLHPDSIAHYDRATFDTQAFNYRLGKNASADSTLHVLTIGGAQANVASYRSITGPAASAVLSGPTSIGLNFQGIFTPGMRAPQKSTPIQLITSLDSFPNPSSLWVRNGVLSIAWHQRYSFCNPDTVNVLRVLRLKVTRSGGNNVTLSAPLDTIYGDPGMWYAFPAICDDSLGRIYLGFQGSSPTTFPSCYLTAMQPGDSTIELNPGVVKAGEKAWTRADGGGHVGRWGDFSSIDLDESVKPPTAYYVGEWGKAATATPPDSLGTWIRSFYFAAISGAPGDGAKPAGTRNLVLVGAWPNPTRGDVRIQISLRRAAQVRLEVEDVRGRRIRLLTDRFLAAGAHDITWNGRDEKGQQVGAGVYLCRVSDGVSASRRKFTLLR